MKVEIGERFANCLTGRVYRVGLINKEWVVLESEDGSSQVLTGRASLVPFTADPEMKLEKGVSKEKKKHIPNSLLKKSFFAGCSKMSRYEAPETLRSEAYLPVRCNDEE